MGRKGREDELQGSSDAESSDEMDSDAQRHADGRESGDEPGQASAGSEDEADDDSDQEEGEEDEEGEDEDEDDSEVSDTDTDGEGVGRRKPSIPAGVLLETATRKAHVQPGENVDCPIPSKFPLKPMTEMLVNSNVWYQAYVVKESANEVKVRFPGAGKGRQDKIEWINKSSSRIWTGSYQNNDWKHLGKGAWAPRSRPMRSGSAGTGSRGRAGKASKRSGKRKAAGDMSGDGPRAGRQDSKGSQQRAGGARARAPQRTQQRLQHEDEVMSPRPAGDVGDGDGASDEHYCSRLSPHVAESPAFAADQVSSRMSLDRIGISGGGGAPHTPPGHDPLSKWYEAHFQKLRSAGKLASLPYGAAESGLLPPGFSYNAASDVVVAPSDGPWAVGATGLPGPPAAAAVLAGGAEGVDGVDVGGVGSTEPAARAATASGGDGNGGGSGSGSRAKSQHKSVSPTHGPARAQSQPASQSQHATKKRPRDGAVGTAAAAAPAGGDSGERSGKRPAATQVAPGPGVVEPAARVAVKAAKAGSAKAHEHGDGDRPVASVPQDHQAAKDSRTAGANRSSPKPSQEPSGHVGAAKHSAHRAKDAHRDGKAPVKERTAADQGGSALPSASRPSGHAQLTQPHNAQPPLLSATDAAAGHHVRAATARDARPVKDDAKSAAVQPAGGRPPDVGQPMVPAKDAATPRHAAADADAPPEGGRLRAAAKPSSAPMPSGAGRPSHPTHTLPRSSSGGRSGGGVGGGSARRTVILESSDDDSDGAKGWSRPSLSSGGKDAAARPPGTAAAAPAPSHPHTTKDSNHGDGRARHEDGKANNGDGKANKADGKANKADGKANKADGGGGVAGCESRAHPGADGSRAATAKTASTAHAATADARQARAPGTKSEGAQAEVGHEQQPSPDGSGAARGGPPKARGAGGTVRSSDSAVSAAEGAYLAGGASAGSKRGSDGSSTLMRAASEQGGSGGGAAGGGAPAPAGGGGGSGAADTGTVHGAGALASASALPASGGHARPSSSGGAAPPSASGTPKARPPSLPVKGPGTHSARSSSPNKQAHKQSSVLLSPPHQHASLGERQASLGERQASLGERQASLGERQASLGERQASLGERQASLGSGRERLSSPGLPSKQQAPGFRPSAASPRTSSGSADRPSDRRHSSAGGEKLPRDTWLSGTSDKRPSGTSDKRLSVGSGDRHASRMPPQDRDMRAPSSINQTAASLAAQRRPSDGNDSTHRQRVAPAPSIQLTTDDFDDL